MQLSQALDWMQGPRAELAARLVTLLLGLWLLYRLAVLVWEIIPAPEVAEIPATAPAAVSAPMSDPRQPRLDIAKVVGWHLFGAPSAAAPTTGGPIDAPDTRLNLVLRGVLSSEDPEGARAIIAEPNGNENYFRVGSALPGGAELTEIYADRIILVRAGQHETLRLPRDAMDGAANAPARLPGAAAPTGDPGALLGEYRGRIGENPQVLLDLARAVPAPAPGGGITGFRLFPGNKPALFAQLGLQPGDLVKEVNGVILDSPVRGAEAMQILRESERLALRIERGGEEINLAVDIPSDTDDPSATMNDDDSAGMMDDNE
jgi:general secretion pathway protein C